jgi:GWxTD domain-containing protein
LKKILFLIVILVSSNIYSQMLESNIFTNIYSFPASDSTFQFFYLYKIPVKTLIFSKTNDTFSAEVQITLELSDSNSNFLQRHSEYRDVKFDDFPLTLDPNTFIEGIISFPFDNRAIVFTSSFFDANSQKEIFTKEQILQKVISETTEFLTPIFLSDKELKCGENNSRVIPNFGEFIPFENNSYDIIIPCTDTTVKKLFVQVISQKDTVFNGAVEQKNIGRISFDECEDKIVLTDDTVSAPTNNFYLTQLTQKLKEGPIEIIVSQSEKFLNKKSFKPIVKWFNKPKSLNDPESAIRLLRFIDKEDSIIKILKSGNNSAVSLNQYWKKKDPSQHTEYNELMAEYYERIDYSRENFSTITGLNGIESNRARIYILYGKPTSIERGSNGDGKVSETWIYSKMQKKFIFVDEKGIGEFILKSTL